MSLGEKLTTVATRMTDVYGRGYVGGYSNGYERGHKIGYDLGVETGINSGFTGGYNRGYQDANEAFWDELQRGGQRINYKYAFLGMGWSFGNFYPLYDIVPLDNCAGCFVNWNDDDIHQGSLKERLALCGVQLDTSNVTNMLQFFANGNITELPVVSLANATETKNVFANTPYLHTIEKVVVSEKTTFNACFDNAPVLENVIFEGVIGQNGLDLSGSPLLSYESVRSVVDCLKDYAGAGGHSVKLGSANLNKLTQADRERAALKGWTLS